MQNFSASPKELVVSLWRNRELIKTIAKREVLGRYRGSAFGLLWSFMNPLIMLTVYTFVFSEIFKTRGGAGNESKVEFALVLFIGLIIFNVFSECINQAPSLILSNSNYVKKVLFPIEILPVVGVLSALFHAAISLLVWLLTYWVYYGVPHASIIFLPLILLPFAMLVFGVSLFLASLGVYVRDVGQVIAPLSSMIMFLSPIFYPSTALPESYRNILNLNPLTPVIEQARSVLFFGQSPDLIMLIYYWIGSFAITCLGFAFFQKTRKGFADVL